MVMIMKKKITLEKIEQLGFSSYEEEVSYIQKQIEDGYLIPLKTSMTNDRNPPLRLKYWQFVKDHDRFDDELRHLHYLLNPTYYLSHQKDYLKVRDYVLALDHYLNHNTHKGFMSKREGSYEIFGYEKVFDENKQMLEHLGLTLADLSLYDTVEPIAYYTNSTFSKALIVENSDPYFTIRDLLLQGQTRLLGEYFDTIIYGAGHRIESTFKEAKRSFLPYKMHHCEFYYCGDLDYEGLSIFYNATKLYPIRPFEAMYRLMLKKAQGRSLNKMPEKQSLPNEKVYSYFSDDLKTQIQSLLQSGCYIPQEIINREDFVNGL